MLTGIQSRNVPIHYGGPTELILDIAVPSLGCGPSAAPSA